MAPSSRSATPGGHTRSRASLHIIPDNRFVVFRGSEHEASPCKLSGIVRLTTSEPTTISRPRIRLEGSRKISWWYLGALSAGEVTDKKTFWNEEKKLGGIESPHKVKAGVIEWRFEFELSPSMPESVEGLVNTYLIYNLHASVSRQGWNARDVVAQQRIRIVRTLGAESMESTRSRINSDIWANKISYSISIPTDAFVFGTSITADVELSPIKKGLRMGKLNLCLVETVTKRIQLSEMPDSRADRSKMLETEVASQEMEFPEDSRIVYEDETIDNPTMGDEMYRFKATLPLPDSLNICRQDVDSHAINVTHKFKLMVNLLNPEGHVSQLVCRLPVKIFISPNLPLNESNQVCRPTNGVSDAELNSTGGASSAPPQYGQHQLDELFSDIDLNGHVTRNASVTGSPSGLDAQSRSGSPDHLGHEHPADETYDHGESHNHALTSLLQSRLADLQEAGPPGLRSPRGAISRRGSQEGNTGDIRQADYDIDNLSRVPSYNRAVQSNGSLGSFGDGPPTYLEATSRPSSPTQRYTPVESADLAYGSAEAGSASEQAALRPPPLSYGGERGAGNETRMRARHSET